MLNNQLKLFKQIWMLLIRLLPLLTIAKSNITLINGSTLKTKKLKISMPLNYQNYYNQVTHSIRLLRLNIHKSQLKNVSDLLMVHSQLVMLNMKNQVQLKRLLTGMLKAVLVVTNVLLCVHMLVSDHSS